MREVAVPFPYRSFTWVAQVVVTIMWLINPLLLRGVMNGKDRYYVIKSLVCCVNKSSK